MKKASTFIFLVALFCLSHVQAQFSLTGTNYSQNFDSLGTNSSAAWANNTTLPGWFALGALTNPVVISNQTGTGTTGVLANFSSTATNSNRSLGWVFANSIGATNTYASIGFGLSNASGLAFDSFSLSYTGRQWRGYSNTTPVLSFQYKIGGTFDNDPTNTLTGSWTDFSSLNFVLPVTNNNARVDGLVAPNFTALSNTVTGLSWGTDQVLWIRWRQQNLSGTDAQLALDDLVFNAFGTPVSGGNYWSAVAGGGGSGTWIAGGTTWATNTGGAGSGQTQSSSTLIFADAAGTVTVSGGVSVTNGINFQTTGYDVQGSTLTLAGAAIANNTITAGTDVTATISSELAGTTGLTKAGNGTLILSGSNSFTGNAVISGGTLEITNDSALGNTANDLSNNGTLKTTASIALDAGRDLSGSGSYDIASATTLTVGGSISNTATTLANTGTLDLQGVTTRNLGSITMNAAGTINAVGAINASGLTASGLTNGTATINPDIVFTTGDKTLNVAAGGALDLNGTLSGNTNRILKTGSGTLILGAANNMGGLRVGSSGATPVDGGTVVLESSVIGTQAQAIQHNYGILSAASNLTFTNGLSIGGRTGAVAVLSGSNMEFQGTNSFFRGTGTSGELRLDINNTTTFSGGFGATSGGGTATGVTFGGTGTLIIGGNGATFTDALTFGSGLTAVRLTSSNALSGATIVGGSEKLEFATTSVDVVGVTGSQNLNLQTADPAPQAVALTMNTAGTITNSGVISGLGSFNKAGAGTVVLAGSNTYAGASSVSAGSLFVNGNQSAANGILTVASGATLGGSGAIGGAVNVAGTLAPGNSIESLSVGALSFSNGSTFAVELNSSVATSVGADLVVANGNLSLESPGTITLTLNDIAGAPAAFSLGTTFSLINYTGSWNNGLFTFGAGTLADGDVFAFGLNSWQIDYNASVGGANFVADQISGNFVNIEAVPEPSTYALIGLAAAGLGAHLVRRRRR